MSKHSSFKLIVKCQACFYIFKMKRNEYKPIKSVKASHSYEVYSTLKAACVHLF